MHAIVLKKLGHDVHVLEKSSADVLRSQAGGLNAGPDVQKFIAEYIQPQEPYTKTSNAVEVINLQGAVINQIPSKDPYQLTTWSLLYRMFKTHFLADGGSVVKYEMEKHVKGIKEDGDKVLVTYSNADGTSHELSADLVIAADGAHSIIRRTVIPDATPPEYAGFVTWRGALSVSEVSAASRAVLEGRMLIFRTDDGGYTVS
jgi:2-polyprenyl-6-methoxyphenol hydroxylase-like FAD-dependent oxidoreductase